MSTAVKLPPKKAISAFKPLWERVFTCPANIALTSSGEGALPLPLIKRWLQKEQVLGHPLCGINIERLVCFIAHQLYRFLGGVLFGFFFTSAYSGAYDLSV